MKQTVRPLSEGYERSLRYFYLLQRIFPQNIGRLVNLYAFLGCFYLFWHRFWGCFLQFIGHLLLHYSSSFWPIGPCWQLFAAANLAVPALLSRHFAPAAGQVAV